MIFHVEEHPKFPWFTQCVTFNFFPNRAHEIAYNLFNLTVMYLAPLIVIIIAYSLILLEITRKSRESHSKFFTKYLVSLIQSVFVMDISEEMSYNRNYFNNKVGDSNCNP